MKKKYTKKQIQEAIAYWQKQLELGNYKKITNESFYSVYQPLEKEFNEEYEIGLKQTEPYVYPGEGEIHDGRIAGWICNILGYDGIDDFWEEYVPNERVDLENEYGEGTVNLQDALRPQQFIAYLADYVNNELAGELGSPKYYDTRAKIKNTLDPRKVSKLIEKGIDDAINTALGAWDGPEDDWDWR